MRKIVASAAAALLSFAAVIPVAAANAQQVIGYDQIAGPICSGPLGPGPCAAVQQYLMQQQQQSMMQPGPSGLPGAGLLPQDGQIVAGIYQACGGEPRCMAASWGAVEVQRCRSGFGVPGGCFGPNGEIMRVVDRALPQNFHPDVIIRNTANDIQHGPGAHNDLVGCDGFVSHVFGGHC
jgi:hypothetical protein